MNMTLIDVDYICDRLAIKDSRDVEIESKRRILRKDFDRIRNFLIKEMHVEPKGTKVFFDQFLDTPQYDFLKKGASLRLRYKNDCSYIYLQYKGPGFSYGNMLFRSEFSYSDHHLILKESKNEFIRFTTTKIQAILYSRKNSKMREAMLIHFGKKIVRNISHCPIMTQYSKEKFECHNKKSLLEPSLDRCFTFFMGKDGIHPIGVFCEMETEIKADKRSLEQKLEDLDSLFDFDSHVANKFKLSPERIDKYQRCTRFFLSSH